MAAGAWQLLKKNTFLPIFLTQFFGAFNDNAFKLAILTLVSYYLSVSQVQSEKYQIIAGILFISPFFLLSATAGQLADKYDKARMTRLIKLFEIVLVSIGGIGFYYGNVWMLMITLLCMGVHSTFFGPIKYAILPDHLPANELLAATGLVEGSTFMAILLGTTLGALSIGGTGVGSVYAISLTFMVAVAGFIASFFIPPAPPVVSTLQVDWHVWRATHNMIKDVMFNKQIMPVIFSISWFWLIGAVLLTKLPDYTNYVLHAKTTVFAVFLALFSIGIAVGSITINRLLQREIKVRFVPYAMLALSLFTCDLYWATPLASNITVQPLLEFFSQFAHLRIAADLFLLAFCGGLYVVPLYTYLQITSDQGMRARTIAANNIFNALFIVVGVILVSVLLYLHIVIPQVFFIVGILNMIAALVLWFFFRKFA